jgi:hypothetical protein
VVLPIVANTAMLPCISWEARVPQRLRAVLPGTGSASISHQTTAYALEGSLWTGLVLSHFSLLWWICDLINSSLVAPLVFLNRYAWLTQNH